MKEMNILYGIDEMKKDFSRYLWVSILSLLENHRNENIHIYILSKYIEESNKKELIRIVESFWKKITFSKGEIVPEKFSKIVCLKGGWPLAAYYRRFFLEKFEIHDRILYLDCDTIVNQNLSEFYNSDFGENVIIWQLDIPLTSYSQKKRFWLKKYINTWVYLINIDLYKQVNLYEEVLKVNEIYGDVDYVDQDYTNIIFNDKIKLYKNLQLISCFLTYSDYSDCLIIHTVQKPNAWWYAYCPKNIENIFNKYLVQTKWKHYLSYKKSVSVREYLNYIIDFWKNYCVYKSIDIFGVAFWFSLKKILDWFWMLCWKILKIIWFIK